MNDGKKIFLLATTVFIMALTMVFLFYDLIVSMNAPPVTESQPGGGGGNPINMATIFIQVIVIVCIASIVLVISIKWKEKKIKAAKNNCDFKRLMKSRR